MAPSVTVDAIPAPTLRAIVSRWVSYYVDEDALRITEEAEISERGILTSLAARWSE